MSKILSPLLRLAFTLVIQLLSFANFIEEFEEWHADLKVRFVAMLKQCHGYA